MRRKKWIMAAAVALLLLFWGVGSELYFDWLWFKSIGCLSVLATILQSYWATRLLAWLFFSLFLFFNFYLSQKAVLSMPNLVLRRILMNTPMGNLLTREKLHLFFLLVSLLLPWLLTSTAGEDWLTARLFLAGVISGTVDPLLGRDIGFYLFRLPFLELVYQYLMMVMSVTILFCGVLYLSINPPPQLGLKGMFFTRGLRHLSVLLALAFLVRAFGYQVQVMGLVLSRHGATFGAGYADWYARRPAWHILTGLCLLAAAVLLANVRLKKPRLLAGSILAVFLASVLLGNAWPALVQSLQVEPNELTREEPFIEHNIRFTRLAYGLDKIERRTFVFSETLGYDELAANRGTISNVRLLDWRPTLETFSQLQGLRLYHRFADVDTDRYLVNGQYRQVLLSARELDINWLENRTWMNERLVYTHGYGVVASPVNEVTGQGQPLFWLRDLPVKSDVGLKLDVPQIYYGELTNHYVITGTAVDEFDYTMGDSNSFYRYEGSGGIPLGGILRRALLAWHLGDYRLLISGEIGPDSRLHHHRNVLERVGKVIPFLRLDNDPYLVIHEGRLFWIVDAFTVSDRFPYSEPAGDFNYIRNAVKVVVDAYNGTMDFYVFEPGDPLIQAYEKIFPGLFKPAEQMPKGLRDHVRYPEQYFKVQYRMYATYHMQDTQVFYNREDRWQGPVENYGGSQQPMEPYYIIIQLPEETEPEFVLMLPYTPADRNNMVAWLAARSDGEKYGQMVVYEFPKGELVYGPAQVEARIDQDPQISEQLTLWDQRGSSVLRGNLLVLPVNGAILYVEPVYLRSEQIPYPELARVIVAYGEKLAMERTLEEALAAVIDREKPGEGEQGPRLPGGEDTGLAELVERAAEAFNRAQEALRRGDWAEYGRLMDELGELLQNGLERE